MALRKKSGPKKPKSPIIEVAAAILWREGSFLAARRPKDKPFGGFWEFPGGKLEPGEEPLAALRRELREELDLGIESAIPAGMALHHYREKNFSVRLHFFHVLRWRGEPRPREGQTLAWLSPQEAGEMNFLPADAAILENLLQPGQD